MERRLMLPRVKIRPYRRGFSIGSRVEVRPRNEDELFYSAVILSREIAFHPRYSKTFTVLYEDGDIEHGLLPSSMIRCSKRILYEGDDLLVEEGAIMVKGIIRRVRLLHFKDSLGIFQSGLLMSSTSVDIPDYSILPFEVNQAMVCGVSLFAGLNRGRLPRKICAVGLGGGAVLSCIFNHIYKSDTTLELWAVDLSPSVIEAARVYFKLPAHVKIVRADGFEFFQTCADEQFDLIILDVADSVDRFLPPACFLDPNVLQAPFSKPDDSRAVQQNPVLVMNVLPERDTAPFHASIAAEAMNQAFSTSYCMDGDPNRVFFGVATDLSVGHVKIAPEEMTEWITAVPGLETAVPGVVRDLKRNPYRFWKKASQIIV